MNDNDLILAELRKIAAWADMQRKVSKWSLVALAVIFAAMVIFAIVMERFFGTSIDDIRSLKKVEWYNVEENIRVGDFETAIQIAEELLARTPQDPDAHHRVASVYLVAGKVEKAKEHFAEAVRLFPSEENEKVLTAINKRIEAENLRPSDPANAASPPR